MSLLLNTLSRFVIAFLPRSKHLLISQLQSLSAVILGMKNIKSATVSIFSPSVCFEVMGLDAMIFLPLFSCVVSFFKLIFYWRIIALQNFVIFCQTSAWISHRYTYIPSVLNLPPISLPSHPLRLMQSPCLSFLSYTANSHWLSILYMVIKFPYISPSPPSPHVHKSFLYVCFSSLSLSHFGCVWLCVTP